VRHRGSSTARVSLRAASECRHFCASRRRWATAHKPAAALCQRDWSTSGPGATGRGASAARSHDVPTGKRKSQRVGWPDYRRGPALLITRGWKGGGDARTTLGRGDRRLRRGLVVTQLAFTVVLLISSGLLVVSFSNLVHRDVGFRDPEGLVTARVPLSGPRYQTPVAQRQFYEALLGRIVALPAVRGAALINEVPGGGGGITTFDPVERPRPPSVRPRG